MRLEEEGEVDGGMNEPMEQNHIQEAPSADSILVNSHVIAPHPITIQKNLSQIDEEM